MVPAEQLAQRLGQGILAAQSALIYTANDLLAEEQNALNKAVEKRQREFATGRVLAHQLIAQIYGQVLPVPQHADRSPIWPIGVVGSISHTKDLCAVLLAEDKSYDAVAVDVEQDDPLKFELWRMILTERETQWLKSQPESEQGKLAKVFFSAKEAFYKGQYPLTRQYLGFHDVEMELQPEQGLFVCTSAYHRLEGVFFWHNHHIWSGVAIGDHSANKRTTKRSI